MEEEPKPEFSIHILDSEDSSYLFIGITRLIEKHLSDEFKGDITHHIYRGVTSLGGGRIYALCRELIKERKDIELEGKIFYDYLKTNKENRRELYCLLIDLEEGIKRVLKII